MTSDTSRSAGIWGGRSTEVWLRSRTGSGMSLRTNCNFKKINKIWSDTIILWFLKLLESTLYKYITYYDKCDASYLLYFFNGLPSITLRRLFCALLSWLCVLISERWSLCLWFCVSFGGLWIDTCNSIYIKFNSSMRSKSMLLMCSVRRN